MEGLVAYPNNQKQAELIYIKLALDRKRLAELPKSVKDYVRSDKSEKFPPDPTTDQAYTPLQFKAYENLSYYVTYHSKAIARLRDRVHQ
jgi:hypothetical protein